VIERAGATPLERLGVRLKRRGYGHSQTGRKLIDWLVYPSDINKSLRQHYLIFGNFPRLIKPEMFNEHIRSNMCFKRKAHHTVFADKLAVRDFVRQRVGSDILNQIFWTGFTLSEARKNPLPRRFVIKANHGSGCNYIVNDVDQIDWDDVEHQSQRWLETDYSMICGESQYRWIKPTLFIEEFLEGEDGQVPVDYKFFCFNGRVEFIQVDSNRFISHRQTFYGRNFDQLPISFGYPIDEGHNKKPGCFDDMIMIAECLAAGEPFLRVDLYDVGRPVFGELTLTPGAGCDKFDPPDWDRRMGDLFKGLSLAETTRDLRDTGPGRSSA
jgi:hypothetical protein